MNDELVFRVAILVLLVAMKVVRWPTRHLTGWKASWPGMKKNPVDTTILFSCSVVWLVVLVTYLCFPQQIAFFSVGLPVWLRWVAVALAVGALFLLGWGDYSLGSNLSVTLEIKQDHTLVTSGPYRWVRHPIYTAALVFFTALSLAAANWLVGLCLIVGIVAIVAGRLRKEEQMMIGQFGDEYRRYMRRTGCLLPRIGQSR